MVELFFRLHALYAAFSCSSRLIAADISARIYEITCVNFYYNLKPKSNGGSEQKGVEKDCCENDFAHHLHTTIAWVVCSIIIYYHFSPIFFFAFLKFLRRL